MAAAGLEGLIEPGQILDDAIGGTLSELDLQLFGALAIFGLGMAVGAFLMRGSDDGHRREQRRRRTRNRTNRNRINRHRHTCFAGRWCVSGW